jgi:transcriptional regulator with XRE-family HTH domain
VTLLREVIGTELRRIRLLQGRTLRDVSATASVSLGYLSEVERGEKEASSEMLLAICGALDVPLSALLASVVDDVATLEGTRLEGAPVIRAA